ncbi:unnamed protein product, partial [Cyprideis torosa]
PFCVEINCGDPGDLINGWKQKEDPVNPYSLGSSILFRCNPDMLLVGNTSTVCQADGTWRFPPPKCMAPCVAPTVSGGTIKGVRPSETIQHGHTISVECEGEFEPNSNIPATCKNGTWTYIPSCVPAGCKELPHHPKNGYVVVPRSDHGSLARFFCLDGYVLEGESFTECRYGTWTGKIPTCKEVFCPFPGQVPNGKVLLIGFMGVYNYRPYVSKVPNDRQIMYECNKGFYMDLRGPTGATCVHGIWRPVEKPLCLPLRHPELPETKKKRRKRSVEADLDTRPALSTANVRRKRSNSRRTRHKGKGPRSCSKDSSLLDALLKEKETKNKTLFNLATLL